MKIFETSLKRGKFDEARRLPNGEMMEFAHVYPMDAIYDTPEDVPSEVILSDGVPRSAEALLPVPGGREQALCRCRRLHGFRGGRKSATRFRIYRHLDPLLGQCPRSDEAVAGDLAERTSLPVCASIPRVC